MKRILLIALLLLCPKVAMPFSHASMPVPPTLAFIAPTTAFTDESFLVDARLSVGVSTMPQADGSPSVTIDLGDGFTANLLATGHCYSYAGIYTIRLTAKSSTGETSTITSTITVTDVPAATGLNVNDGVAQNVIDMTNAAGNASYYIAPANYANAAANATKLQAAINHAAGQNSVEQEVVLPCGATFAGPIVDTRPTGGNKYITLKSPCLTVARNNRVGPATMTTAPAITSPASTDFTAAAMWTPNPAAANPSHHYRLIGLKFKKDSANQSMVIVSLGDHNNGQFGYSMQPTYFIIDRCLFDGDTTSTSNLGLRIAADFVTVKDSYFTGFKVISGIDACAIAYSKGKGILAIRNNYLEASSENFYASSNPIESWTATVSVPTTTSCTLSSVTGLEVDMNIVLPVGGATSYSVVQSTIVRSISGNNITFDAIPSAPFDTGTAKWAITPSFIEFRRNYCFKPLTWRASDPSWDGSNWQIKNLWETKAMRYGIIDGNVLQNAWVGPQAWGIALTPRMYSGFEHEAAVIRQLQFSNNIFRNMGNGVAITAWDDQIGHPNTVQLTRDITFRNNLWRNIGETWDPTSGPYRAFFGFASITSPLRLRGMHLIHNTFDAGTYSGTGMAITAFGVNGDGSGVVSGTFLNNLMPGIGGFFSTSSSNNPAANITEFMAPGDSTSWNKNEIVNTNSLPYPAAAITETAAWATAVFNDYTNGDFTLKIGDPGKLAALDGTDIGASWPTVNAATLHDIDGQWAAGAIFCSWVTTPNVCQ